MNFVWKCWVMQREHFLRNQNIQKRFKILAKVMERGSFAIKGVRVKKMMSSWFERSPYRGTDAFYLTSKFCRVQKLLHFEVQSFSRISFKKGHENWTLGCFTYFWTTFAFRVQCSWNLQHSFHANRQQIWRIFFEKYCQLLILRQFYMKIEKMPEKTQRIVIFRHFFVQNWHKIKTW